MVKTEIVLFIIASILIVVNVIVVMLHKKINRVADEVINNNELIKTRLEIKKVEQDEKESTGKYQSDRDKLQADVDEYSSKPPSSN